MYELVRRAITAGRPRSPHKLVSASLVVPKVRYPARARLSPGATRHG